MNITKPIHDHGKSVAQMAEQQMRQWALGLEVKERIENQPTVDQLPAEIHPYIAVSREAGAGGAEIATRVGRELDWEVLNRELLSYMAERYKLPRDMLDCVDETTWNWMLEVFGKWINRRVVTQSEYIVHLARLVLMAARHSSKVFVGRGAQFLLPRDRGLTIYVIAPVKMRIKRILEVRHCSENEAKQFVRETDRGRRDFVQTYFNRNVDDEHVYDLVINREHIDLDAAAQLIVDQCRKRFGQ